ncbi:hypothetical protein WA026_004882 [Henosepilachna vigintioctopunctata]|uniref:Uncharacterized protein n=1 Tax=Henosepilachna vigintioctopunctata TaxID=420089 RepID=A0AAW1UTX7_9CUCU
MAEFSTSSRQVDQKQWREKFLAEISKSEMKRSSHFNVILSDNYSKLFEQVEDAEKSEKRTPLKQRRLKRFGVLILGDIKKLIVRREGSIKYYLQADELYDVIDAAHVAVGRDGRDRMLAETSKNMLTSQKK